MSEIKIGNSKTRDNETCYAIAPFSSEFVKKAKLLGGKWGLTDGVRSWIFPRAAKIHLENLCIDIYGENGKDPVECVTLQISFPNGGDSDYCKGIEAAGRSICYASGRDSGAKVSDGVVFLRGGCKSAGSVKNWYTKILTDSVVEIYNMPRPIAEKYIATDPDSKIIEIVKTSDRKQEILVEIAQYQSKIDELQIELDSL